MKDFAKSIRVGNAFTKGQVLGEEGDKKYVFGGEINGTYIVHRQPDGKTWSFSSEQERKDWMRNSKIGNSKVGNGSGSWRGKFYEDSAGNSASVEKRGEGWEVYWEDARGYGKPLGTYKDERTAREVAEDAVESEMPDRIRASYKSKAINSKVGNANKTFSGKYLDIYDNGIVVAKEGWAFGERFNENTFGRWIDEQIRAKEKTLQECKQMKREFESNY